MTPALHQALVALAQDVADAGEVIRTLEFEAERWVAIDGTAKVTITGVRINSTYHVQGGKQK